MSEAGPEIQYRRYRAPRSSGETLADPPLHEVPGLAQANARLLSNRSNSWCGLPLASLAASARAELMELARRHTSAYRNISDADVSGRVASAPGEPALPHSLILLTGHQPELFHPGVWYKNFVLDRLARSLGATAIHLIVDNDTAGAVSIRVPAGSVAKPHLETVPLDQTTQEIPWEERAIIDGELFASFGERVVQWLKGFVAQPLICEWWPSAVRAAQSAGNLGLALAQARHELEWSWGLKTWEVPLSRVCDSRGFRSFVAGVLAELPRFVEDYNRSLLEYRRVNRIRSHAHPVPQLERQGEWLEAPCWVWTTANPLRRRLFVRNSPAGLELGDRGDLRVTVAPPACDGGEAWHSDLSRLATEGVKLRPRALLTTMYARLVLSDLFLHGIGGGKYDQLTDAIVRRFFGIEPPGFLVLSATLQLPIDRPEVGEEQVRQLNARLRDVYYHPDRHVIRTAETEPLIETKRRWLAAALPRGERRPRHEGIQQANAALREHVVWLRERLVAERDATALTLHQSRLLGSREFAFCLFPEATLRALLLDKR
jgi:hypothetical protein